MYLIVLISLFFVGASLQWILLKKRLVILTPKASFLDLTGGAMEPEIEEDFEALRDLFAECNRSRNVESCDILFVYATFDSDINIDASSVNLRAAIRDSGAKAAFIATSNSEAAYEKIAKFRRFGRCNLVLNYGRAGNVFSVFCQKLFEKMNLGEDMLSAWRALEALRIEEGSSEPPKLACLWELGPIKFKKG